MCRHRTILMTLYSTGMRRSELCRLRTEDIDKHRMVIRIVQGKGGKDREVPLSPKLLEQLRAYYRTLKVKSAWVFQSLQERHRGEPMTDKSVWHACQFAARRAGITKHVHPHTLRHASAYCTTFQSRFILKTIGLGRARFAGVYGCLAGQLSPAPAPLVTASQLSR
jgi:site-specific recombinase XerD